MKLPFKIYRHFDWYEGKSYNWIWRTDVSHLENDLYVHVGFWCIILYGFYRH